MLQSERCFLLIGITVLLSACSGGHEDSPEAPSTAPLAVVSGPVTNGAKGFPATPAVVDLEAAGYIEEEYFFEGTASAYEEQGEWGSDGVWPVQQTTTAEYKTRMLVRRPRDPAQFSGVVVVEWLNVTSGIDIDPWFGFASTEILREGHAWVGVTAQAIAIDSIGGGSLGPGAVGLIAWDPLRYDTLFHPGDAYSYAIFSQAGAVLTGNSDVDPLGGLRPLLMLAAGQSQSGLRMLTYVNAIHPGDRIYDGFFIHSRAGTGAALGEGYSSRIARVRDDLEEPTLQFITETELFELAGADFGFTRARQPDSESVRTWEITGTAHADAHYLTQLMAQGNRQFEQFLDLSSILDQVNSAPQYLAVNAALHGLVEWAEGGAAPAGAAPIDTDDSEILRDANGNALGGLRLPHVQVPVAVQSGEGVIPFSGKTVPFDAPTLAALYPDSQAYIAAVEASARAAVDAGYLLPEDAANIIAEAEADPPVD